ncbi:MAG: hypothetical protein WCL27_02290 [Betaproteobacteria bacterium]
MEKGILVALATGVIALFLYVSMSQKNDAERDTLIADHAVQREEFKKEFSKAAGEPQNPEQDKVLAAAQVRLEKARAAQEVVSAENRKDMSLIHDAASKEIGIDPNSIAKIKDQVNSTGGNK